MTMSHGQPVRRLLAPRVYVPLALLLLLALVAVQTMRYWQYFPMFIGDQGWFLQVAARLSQGETLYSDVIWAYGPLSAQALAALFRLWGPNAGLATLINGLLAAASLLFIYSAVRSLLRPPDALIVVAFAAVTGGHMAGDLIRQHLLVYNQSVSWGLAASLGALAAALRWHGTRRSRYGGLLDRRWLALAAALRWHGTRRSRYGGLLDRRWLALAGAATGLAFLAKPEFGATALAAVAILLLSSRAPARAWLGWLAAAGLTAALGFAWQASASGWQALWRGYSGYDMVAQGAFWGSDLGPKRWLASVAAFWLAAALLWLGWRHAGRGRWLFYAGAMTSLGLGVVAVASTVVLRFPPQTALAEISWRWWVSGVMQWLMAAPWALLTPLLLAAAWLARRFRPPPPWWTLWAFALLANLRLLLQGFSSGVAIALALAVLAWLLDARAAAQPPDRAGRRWRPAALAILLVLTGLSLAAQVLTPDLPARAQRRWLSTDLGGIAIGDPAGAAQAAAIQASIADRLHPGETLFAYGWGAAWYLLTGRANRTAFDVVLGGMIRPGGVEAAQLEQQLTQQPPAVVILPVEYWPPGSETQPAPNRFFAMPGNLQRWWERLQTDYVAAPALDNAKWMVLWRR